MCPQLCDPLGNRLLSTAVSTPPVLTLFFVLVVLKKRVWLSALRGPLEAVTLAVFRAVFRRSVVLACLVGLIVLCYAYVSPSLIP